MATKITVYKKAQLTAEQIKVLTYLYLPILGKKAYSLYLSFAQLVNFSVGKSLDFDHNFFINLLNISPQKLIETRRRLEAIGLIDTFENQDKLVLILNNPLTANSFFANPNLHVLLQKNIPSTETYNSIKQIFHTNSFISKNYTNITETNLVKTFGAFDPKKIAVAESYGIDKTRVPEFISEFDFAEFTSFLTKLKVPFSGTELEEESYKSRLISLALNFSLKEKELAEIFIANIVDKKVPKIDALKVAISTYRFSQKTTEDDTSEITKWLSNIGVKSLVEAIKQQTKVTKIDAKEFVQLIEFIEKHKENVNLGVLNMLILHSCKYQQKEYADRLPTNAFLEKALNIWIIDYKVKTTKDAVLLSQKLAERFTSNTALKTRKTNSNNSSFSPSWADKLIERF